MDALEKTTARGPAIFLVSLLLALLAAPGLAQPWKARSPAGDLLLVRTVDGYAVESATGDRTRLPLPGDARVNDFRAAGDGWLAAAVVDGEGGQVIIVTRGGPSGDAENRAVAAREPLLLEPLLLVRGAELAAVAWLEGKADDRLAVRAARLVGGEWQPPQTISPPGRGTQIALTAAVLADGSWLVAWAAFDGHDDEILWSRSADGNPWSAPQRLAADNRVPDITPHLYADDAGAFVAWSRYDGNDYRVQVARFDGAAWSEPATVGVPGSVDPVFDDGERPVLVYRRAVPRGWTVVELDGGGDAPEAVRQVEIVASGNQRPLVSEVTAEGVRLRWPGGRKTGLVWQPAVEVPR